MGTTPVFEPLNELENLSFAALTIAQITKDFARISVDFNFEKDKKIELSINFENLYYCKEFHDAT